MKKLLVILLALLLPVAAGAEVYVAGNDVSEGGFWKIRYTSVLTPSREDEEWNLRYDPGTATLTLRDAHIRALDEVCGVQSDGDLTIVLVDGTENSIRGGLVPKPEENVGATWDDSLGVVVAGELTITGAGKLTVESQMGGNSRTIRAKHVRVSYAELVVQAGEAGAFSLGVNGDLTVNSANVSIASGLSALHTYGVWGTVKAENSTLTIMGGPNDNWHSLGVYGRMDVTNCILTVKGDVNAHMSDGLSGSLKMKGGRAEFIGNRNALLLGTDGLSLSEELRITGAATPDGELGAAVLASDGKSIVVGNDPAGTVIAQRVVIAPDESEEDDDPAPVPGVLTPPATGDGAHPALWLALMAFAGAALIAVRRRYN